jgi:hypothetical protein
MSTTLTTIILTKAADWAFGKALDVIWDCLTCKDKNPGRIGNVMHNDLECPNCHKVHRQFTNACPTTVRLTDGRIGHIGVSYAGLIPDDRSTLQKLFGDAPPPRCGFDLHVNQLPAVQLERFLPGRNRRGFR